MSGLPNPFSPPHGDAPAGGVMTGMTGNMTGKEFHKETKATLADSADAQCPDCEGSGRLLLGVHVVSQEMASDAGEPDMQGQEIPEWGHCSRCHGAGVITADAPPEVTEEMTNLDLARTALNALGELAHRGNGTLEQARCDVLNFHLDVQALLAKRDVLAAAQKERS